MPPRNRQPEQKPRSMAPDKALVLLKEKIAVGIELQKVNRHDPKITEWERSVENLLVMAFGNPNDNLNAWHREGSYFGFGGESESEAQRDWERRHQAQLAVLNSAVEQLSWQSEG